MRFGRFEVKKFYQEGKPLQWAVMAWNDQRQQVVCFDETRTPKELLFDLQYDACCYLQGFIDFIREDYQKKRLQEGIDRIRRHPHADDAVKRAKKRAKAKLAKRSRKRNR